MKFKFLAAMTAIGASLFFVGVPLVGTGVLISGCATNGTNGINQAVIDTSALILQAAARDGAIYAIQDSQANSNYFALAKDAIGTFLTGRDFTPGALQNDLMAITNSTLNNMWVQLAIGGVIDLYSGYWSTYVKGQVNGNIYAGTFLKAIQDGFSQALGTPITPAVHAMSAARFTTAKILPRPVPK